MMLQGMGRGLAQQKPGQQPGQQPQQGPNPQNPWAGGQSPWQGQAAVLQGLGRGLGAQTWGDPGQGAPTINPPQNMGRPMPRPIPTVQNAEALQQGAAQYAAGARPPQDQEDLRFRGMR